MTRPRLVSSRQMRQPLVTAGQAATAAEAVATLPAAVDGAAEVVDQL